MKFSFGFYDCYYYFKLIIESVSVIELLFKIGLFIFTTADRADNIISGKPIAF